MMYDIVIVTKSGKRFKFENAFGVNIAGIMLEIDFVDGSSRFFHWANIEYFDIWPHEDLDPLTKIVRDCVVSYENSSK